jgi:hypothetical protein
MKKILFMILVVMVALASCDVVPATVVGYDADELPMLVKRGPSLLSLMLPLSILMVVVKLLTLTR